MRLKTWQSKGYMGNNVALQDFSQVNENVISGKVGIVAGPRWFADYPVKQLKARDSQAEFIPYPIPSGPDGTAGRLAGNSYSAALLISKDISEEALQAFLNTRTIYMKLLQLIIRSILVAIKTDMTMFWNRMDLLTVSAAQFREEK